MNASTPTAGELLEPGGKKTALTLAAVAASRGPGQGIGGAGLVPTPSARRRRAPRAFPIPARSEEFEL